MKSTFFKGDLLGQRANALKLAYKLVPIIDGEKPDCKHTDVDEDAEITSAVTVSLRTEEDEDSTITIFKFSPDDFAEEARENT